MRAVSPGDAASTARASVRKAVARVRPSPVSLPCFELTYQIMAPRNPSEREAGQSLVEGPARRKAGDRRVSFCLNRPWNFPICGVELSCSAYAGPGMLLEVP